MNDSTPKSWWKRLSGGLKRSSSSLGDALAKLSKVELDAAAVEELEGELVRADLGPEFASHIVQELSEGRFYLGTAFDEVKAALAGEIEKVLEPVAKPLEVTARPFIILVAGVNGSGKTTTIGKLAARLSAEGRKVMLAAGDTFRAAAEEQLEIWADRANAEFVGAERGADPASVAYDAIEAATRNGRDVVIVDTAGRLHTQSNLMQELAKVRRVIEGKLEGAPHETLLVVDATTGQNGLQQARLFGEAVGVTGVALTKLDGSAKGGIAVAIAHELGLPVKLIGVGESLEDLRPFDSHDFARALVGGT